MRSELAGQHAGLTDCDQPRTSRARALPPICYVGELFAATWPGQTDDFAQRMNTIRKYVFSSTLASADWSNSTIVRGDVVAQVTKLKEQDGRDLALFGHGRLAQALRENGLIDELRLSIHPVLAGAGLPQFTNGDKTRLTLVSAKTFATGVVVLSYQTAGAWHE